MLVRVAWSVVPHVVSCRWCFPQTIAHLPGCFCAASYCSRSLSCNLGKATANAHIALLLRFEWCLCRLCLQSRQALQGLQQDLTQSEPCSWCVISANTTRSLGVVTMIVISLQFIIIQTGCTTINTAASDALMVGKEIVCAEDDLSNKLTARLHMFWCVSSSVSVFLFHVFLSTLSLVLWCTIWMHGMINSVIHVLVWALLWDKHYMFPQVYQSGLLGAALDVYSNHRMLTLNMQQYAACRMIHVSVWLQQHLVDLSSFHASVISSGIMIIFWKDPTVGVFCTGHKPVCCPEILQIRCWHNVVTVILLRFM